MRKFLKKILDDLLNPTTLIIIFSMALFFFGLFFLKKAYHSSLILPPIPLFISLLSIYTIMICVDKTRKTLSLLQKEISRLKKIEEKQAMLSKLLNGTITGKIIDDIQNDPWDSTDTYLLKDLLPDDIIIGPATPVEKAWYNFSKLNGGGVFIFAEEVYQARKKENHYCRYEGRIVMTTGWILAVRKH